MTARFPDFFLKFIKIVVFLYTFYGNPDILPVIFKSPIIFDFFYYLIFFIFSGKISGFP